MITGSDVNVLGRNRNVKLAGDRARFRKLFRLQTLPLQHIEEISIAAKIQLIGAIKPHSTLAEQICQHAVHDSRPHLALDIVADDWQPTLLEPPPPAGFGCDEYRDAIDKGAARFEAAFGVPLGGTLRADGKIGNDDISAAAAQNVRYVRFRFVGFFDLFAQVAPKPIKCATAPYLDAGVRDICELVGIIRVDENGLGHIPSHL